MRKTGLIVALDDLGDEKAFELAQKLRGMNILFKANDLLDSELGPKGVIDELRKSGDVMADPKIHDIPNTAANRTKRYAAYGPKFLTVHGSGTIEMIRAAVKKRGETDILVVSVLTTINEEECQLNLGASTKAMVLQYARNAVLAKAQGIVSSGQELEFLAKFEELNDLLRVVPGIRPLWHLDPKDDQKRIMTPKRAVELGANYLVIGRPITRAENPIQAVELTLTEILEAESSLTS